MNNYGSIYSNLKIQNNDISNLKLAYNNKNKSPKSNFDVLSNFGSSKFVLDSSLNKYYKMHLLKQAQIQHEQKLYELIEQLDDPKSFNNLRVQYLKEKALLQNIHNLKKEKKTIIYSSNCINLHNYEEKLNTTYKLSAPENNFMSSLMHFLGNRPKKVFKPKINKKLIALSQGRHGKFRKKREIRKNESKTISNSNTINNTLNNYNCYSNNNINKPHFKNIFKQSLENNNTNSNTNNNTSNNINDLGNKKDKNYSNKNNINKRMSLNYNNYYRQYHSQNNIRKKSVNLELNHLKNNRNLFDKTNSTNFGITTYNNFTNSNYPNDTLYSIYNKTDNLISNSESQNNNSITEENNLVNNNNINHYKQLNKSKFNSQTSLFSMNNRSKNSNAKNISSKDYMNIFNSKKKNDLGILLLNLKKQDKTTIKNKLIKVYKNTMHEFLQKIKDEEKDLHSNSNKLSSLLFKFKKYGKFEEIKNKSNLEGKESNIKYKTMTNFYQTLPNRKSTSSIDFKKGSINNIIEDIMLKNEQEKNSKTLTFYPSWGKSKYSIPYINKIVYGAENSIDTFEQLQKDLFFETKGLMRKANIINKRLGKKIYSVKGRDILDKFKKNNNKEEI